MKGSECKLTEYMSGSMKRFVIPVYQRNYDWKTEQCKQLFDDLIKVISNDRSSHFFGSVVSVYRASRRNIEFLVIDGQQRLTTVSLLLLAMYNLLQEGKAVSADQNLGQTIFEDYLVDKFQPQDTRIKLKPVKNDQKAFEKLFEKEEEHINGSNLTINYKYFYDRIQKQEISIDELYDAIWALEIINITLDEDDNPQLIFESLNSTGLDLSEGDKIRNYILMGLPTKLQNEYYEKYWNKIEECTRYDVSAFVRDYLSILQQAIPAQKKIYINFKEYVEAKKLEPEALLEDMLAYAKRYYILLSGEGEPKEIKGSIYRLNRLENSITRPFFLEVLRLRDEKVLSNEEVTDIFLITENYLLRRFVCDLPTNVLNKIFLLLHKEIIRYDGTASDYVKKFKYALTAKKDRARFPEDDEFAVSFSERPIYLMNMKNKLYILERLENNGTAEDKDIYRHCDDNTYSIEHIMPQHLTPAWIDELGNDYEQIHETWLHRIANLTLTAYNSKYSNNSFKDKKHMKNGFIESGIRMNMFIAMRENWTLKELEERSQYLTEKALEIWSYPVSEYVPVEKVMDYYSLDDDASFSGRLIARYSYKKTEQPVESWVEMYESIIKILHTEDGTVLPKLAYAPVTDPDYTSMVSSNKESLRGYIQIDEGIFVEKHCPTESKLTFLRKLFSLYDADPSDLVFYLREGADTPEDEAGSRYERRRKYWAFALGTIKAANVDTGLFSKVNPSKENWVSGFFGIGGFTVNCLANYDCARVEVYFGKANKEENKAAFDKVFLHRKEIETKLGVSLEWNRGDEIKSSKIYYQLSGVSIEKEVDWRQMAAFHGEWSKKLFDVIIPYIQ